MDTRSSFSSICMLWISVCVGLHSGESVISVSGDLGSTAVLPCELKSVDIETHIRWRTESEIVFKRKGESFSQGDGYEDRVDVPVEELRKGNCSLVLRNLQLTDTNVYMSIQMVRRIKRSVTTEFKEISRVSLSVREKPPEEKSDEVSSPTDVVGMVHPHPLIMISITALISYFLVLLFYEETWL
ncbi:uncharacterized protein LOC124392796 isoform X4 [Silurus meridionalis]|uniref:Immunoglobulin V-set domain-containing protein n=1 Tax=Silurus meridionalis TaxID=175797 RepID=A0A8T0BCF1_SILME|nr:uncharacterized protein LOC124392796 isoform X4 [Silurus meridionalis]KAF7702518.1 hypothetical protein HF521_001801 [Silurus meridionalis]